MSEGETCFQLIVSVSARILATLRARDEPIDGLAVRHGRGYPARNTAKSDEVYEALALL
jgi:hypothetical protein